MERRWVPQAEGQADELGEAGELGENGSGLGDGRRGCLMPPKPRERGRLGSCASDCKLLPARQEAGAWGEGAAANALMDH